MSTDMNSNRHLVLTLTGPTPSITEVRHARP